jgi:uncharacterized damage-inducible protein DinB
VNLREILVPEWRIEAATTRRVLERVPVDRLDYRPHAASRTLGELAAHIAVLPELFLARLPEEGLRVDDDAAPPADPAGLLERFDRSSVRALEALESLSDERFLEPWTYRRGERVVFTLPRLVVARTTALNHVVHHRGQLTVYLRMLNVPVPSVYGPSADERSTVEP